MRLRMRVVRRLFRFQSNEMRRELFDVITSLATLAFTVCLLAIKIVDFVPGISLASILHARHDLFEK